MKKYNEKKSTNLEIKNIIFPTRKNKWNRSIKKTIVRNILHILILFSFS